MQTPMLGIEGLKSQTLCNTHKSWVNQPNIKRGLFRPLFFGFFLKRVLTLSNIVCYSVLSIGEILDCYSYF